MKRLFIYLVVILATFLSHAQVPGTLSYQGLLTLTNGTPVANGQYQVTFRFYKADGTQLAPPLDQRGPLTIDTFNGLFTKILGDGTASNAALPASFGSQEVYIGITVSPSSTELTPRVRLTSVPYAYVAQSANSVAATNVTGTLAGTQVGSGIDAANITTGTLPPARIGTLAIANGGTNTTTAVDARNSLGLAIGTNVQAYDADLDDLADGTLTGSKVDGTTLSTVSATNITTGTLALANGGTGATTQVNARTNLGLTIGTNVQAYDADLDDLADGTLTGTKVDGSTLTTISATNITTGTLPLANGGTGATTAVNARTSLGLVIGTNVQAFDADLTDLADGTLSGAVISLTGTDASKLASGTGQTHLNFDSNGGKVNFHFQKQWKARYNFLRG